MLTLFFDRQGPLRIEFLSEGGTINAERYVETLTALKNDISNKRREGPQPNILLHDNARPHTAVRTKQALEKLKFDLLPHCLLYTSPSPRDLSTSRMPSSA